MQQKEHEPEHSGSLWKHPYVIYIWITALIFGILIFVGWLALSNGWIPNRGAGSDSRVSSFGTRQQIEFRINDSI